MRRAMAFLGFCGSALVAAAGPVVNGDFEQQ